MTYHALMAKTKRAAIYCRISRDRTGAEAGVDRQRHDCAELVKARGWELVDTFTDNDLSAYSGKPRPAYAEMLEAVRAGRVDVVVAWHQDRLTRQPRELEDLIDALEAARCEVETVRAGRIDLSTRSGRTNARLHGTLARDESEAKSERLQAMHAAKARAGEWPGGPRPYGYRPKDGNLEVVDTEAEVVREAARRVLAGESLHGICADLNARSIPTARGALWRPQTLRRILTTPTTVGRREHRGDDVGPATWPAILDARTGRRVRAVLERPDRARGRVARVALLAGRVTCSLCGAKLISQRRQSGARTYVCPARTLGGCGGISVAAEPLDALVAAAVVAFLDRGDLTASADDTDEADRLAAELAELESDLEFLAEDFGAGRITRAQWLRAREPLEARRDATRARLHSATGNGAAGRYAGRGAVLAAEWPALTLDQRRAIVAAVVERVEVTPAKRRGPGLDPERVRVDWR